MSKVIPFLKRHLKKTNVQLSYSALLMFYAFKSKNTPCWAKNIIMGVIGYLLMPIDLLPDFTPIIGFTDDLGVLAFGLVTTACYVDDGVREKSRAKMDKWYKTYNEEDLVKVDQRL